MASSPKVKVAEAFMAEGNRPLSIDELCELTYLSRHHVTTVLKSGGYSNNGKLRNTQWFPEVESARGSPPGAPRRPPPPKPIPQRYQHMTRLSEAVERKLISLPQKRLHEMLQERTSVTRTDTVYTAVQILARVYKEGELAVLAYE
jgi:hypothetical protein